MLRALIFSFAVICAALWYAPDVVTAFSGTAVSDHRSQTAERRKSRPKRANSERRDSRTKAAARQLIAKLRGEPRQTSRGRKVRLKVGRGGHYRADVRINGTKLRMMVDTGASLIALTARDAKRMGVYPKPDKFVYKTRTANGLARVAVVELKEVKIGGIRLKNVKASVHKGKGLSTNLLGMSFLNRLRKFNFEGDTLTLVN